MKQGLKAVVWFNEVTKKDIPLVGGKGANLGEMTNAGIPVPPGFIVTAAAYFDFIEKSGLQDKIKALLNPIDVNDSKQLQETALKVQKLVQSGSMPPETAREIEQAYVKMGKGSRRRTVFGHCGRPAGGLIRRPAGDFPQRAGGKRRGEGRTGLLGITLRGARHLLSS